MALLMLSCQSESRYGSNNNTLQAYIAYDDVSTKTALVDNPGVRMVSSWTTSDHIGIFGGSASNLDFAIDASTLSDNGKRADFKSSSSVPKGSLTGYSPYQVGATTGSNGSIVLDFPAIQHSVSVAGAMERPDPAANILYGSGSSDAGMSFRPVMALVKVGQRFEDDITITSVEFRDLSGAAVAGSLSISGDSATITGSEKTITVDFGENGIFIPAGVLHPVFIVVPARNYSKGFEITFVDSEGGRTVKNVGAQGGKSLAAGILHPIGEVSGKEPVHEAKSSLKPEATIVTEEMAQQVRVISLTTDVVRDVDGEPVKEYGYNIHRPALDLLVSDDLAPAPGHWFIFNYGDSRVPDGGIFRIETVQPLGGGYSRVYATTEPNFGAPFEEIILGEEMFDAEGNEIENAGSDLDISSYLSEIRDADGNTVPFTRAPDGTICLSEDDMATALTKAAVTATKDVSLPGLKVSYSGDNCSANLGATLNIGMRAAVKVEHGEVDFVHFTFHPTLDLHADFNISKEISKSKQLHLFTLYFAPGIPVAPGVILTPTMDVSAGVNFNASITLSTSIDYTYDMGRFGFSYQYGQGFMFRHFEAEPSKKEVRPQLGASLSGKVSAGVSIIAEPSIQFYGLFGAGLKVEYGISFNAEYSASWSSSSSSDKDAALSLSHGITITPYTASLGGYFTKTWDKLKVEIELDDIWKRYLLPKFTYTRASVSGENTVELRDYKGIKNGQYCKFELIRENYPPLTQNASLHTVFTQINGIITRISIPKDTPTLDNWDIYCDIETGSTDVSWSQSMLWGTMIGTYIVEDVTYAARTPLSENKVFTISAGNDKGYNEQNLSGTAADFPEGRIRSFSLRAVNLNNGLELVLMRSAPFTFYWPETPLGSLFRITPFQEYTDYSGTVHTAKEQYDAYYAYTWPADVPMP